MGWPTRSPDLSPCDFFLLGIPKRKGFQTSSSISWGFEGQDTTGNWRHSTWDNPESDGELPGNVFSNVLPTTAAKCLIRFLKPTKNCFYVLFRNIYNFFLHGFFHFLYLFKMWEIFMPHPVLTAFANGSVIRSHQDFRAGKICQWWHMSLLSESGASGASNPLKPAGNFTYHQV